jgi:hypothetical protein
VQIVELWLTRHKLGLGLVTQRCWWWRNWSYRDDEVTSRCMQVFRPLHISTGPFNSIIDQVEVTKITQARSNKSTHLKDNWRTSLTKTITDEKETSNCCKTSLSWRDITKIESVRVNIRSIELANIMLIIYRLSRYSTLLNIFSSNT